MPPHPSITIPQPCHESWVHMTPAAQGRHCATCQKMVIDFTQMTDTELLQILGQSSGKLCGRFTAEQLARPLRAAAAPGVAPWRVWLASALAVLSLREILPPAARAQTPVAQQATSNSPTIQSEPTRPQVSDSVTITGVVVDSVNKPVPGVTVLLKGTTFGMSSSVDGEFSIIIPPNFLVSRTPVIAFSSVGYISQEVPIDLSQPHQPWRIQLAPDWKALSETIIVGGACFQRPWYTPSGLWQRATRIFRRY